MIYGILVLLAGGFLVFMGLKHRDSALKASDDRQFCRMMKELGQERHLRKFAGVKAFAQEKAHELTSTIFMLVGIVLAFYGLCLCYAGCSNSAPRERSGTVQSRTQSKAAIGR